MLLICTPLCVAFSASAATSAPMGPDQILAQVESAAKLHVLRQADAAGMVEPAADVAVVAGSRPLSACGKAITVEAVETRMPARMRFAAVCAGRDSWRYEFVVRATLSARVAVAAMDIPAGRVLGEEDVLLERRDISTVVDSIADSQEVVGLSGKRALRGGELLRTGLLASPTVVKRGDVVRIVARSEQVEVSMSGEALDSGARGTLVRVRNANGTIIRAKVTGVGTVAPADVPVSTN